MEQALDVMVRSPHAQDSQGDCTEEGKRHKLSKYKDAIPKLQEIGINYTPFVVSCYGRLHEDVQACLAEAARKAARDSPGETAKMVCRRWKNRLAVAIWQRTARMAHACLNPRADPDRESCPSRDQQVVDEAQAILFGWEEWE